MYVFAVVGVWVLGGYLSALPSSVYANGEASFDTIGKAWLALYQVCSHAHEGRDDGL